MRVIAIALVLVVAVQAIAGAQLPPGFNSASDVASVLANEPDAARFMATSEKSCLGEGAGCGNNKETDGITFSSSVKTVSSLGGSSAGGAGGEETSEFDAQIEQIEGDLKKLEEEKKVAEESAKRVKELAAEIRNLKEQKEHLEREKQKAALQKKLEAQMKDLNEINSMSRALRSKFSELKRTQQLIKSRMSGTRSTLNDLEGSPQLGSDADIAEAAGQITKQVDAMHKTQKQTLESSHKAASKDVSKALKQAHANKKASQKEDKDF